MKAYIKKIIEVAEGLDWSVNVDDNELEFSKPSTAGQDFNFTVTGDTAETIISEIRQYHDNFDCSEETYIWLDESGHGKNGAPYDMKDVYEDMEECNEMVEELYETLCGEILAE
jgi:hypothetical protein